MIDEDLSFEDAIYFYYQSLNPTRKINRSDIFYNEVKNIIEKFMFCKKNGIDDCNGIVSAPESPTEKKTLKTNVSFFHKNFFADAFNESVDDSNTFLPSNGGVKIDRRTLQYKRTRKNSSKKKEFVAFDCSEADLLTVFNCFFDDILLSRSSSVDCCNIIVNSLAVFYAQNTWSSKVQESVLNFLHLYVIKDSAKLCQEFYMDEVVDKSTAKKTLQKIQVICLLELLFVKFVKLKITESNIVEKLYLLQYIFGDEELKKFINEFIQTEFGRSLPDYLFIICEIFKIPVIRKKRKFSHNDLQCSNSIDEYEGKSSRHADAIPSKIKRRNSTNSFRKMKVVDDGNSSESDFNELTPLLEVNAEFEKNGVTSDASSSSPSPLRRMSLIANKREQRRRIDSSSDNEKLKSTKDVVKKNDRKLNISAASPVRRGPKLLVSKILNCLQPKNQKTLRPDIKSKLAETKVKLTEAKIEVAKFCLRKKVIKKKLLPPQLNVSNSSVTSKKKSRSLVSTQKKTPTLNPHHHRGSISINTASISNLAESPKNATFVLDEKTLSQYQKRMEVIKSNSRTLKLNTQEVFYGRCNARTGLFDEDQEKTDDAQNSKSQQSSNESVTTQNRRQKNRSGRAIQTPHENCVHVAHTLLNVRNAQPLVPFKARNVPVPDASCVSKSIFKIRKFIKLANRSERKRMEKLKKNASIHNNNNFKQKTQNAESV